MIEITDEMIEQGKSKAGGWTRFQLGLLGVSWPPRHGWRQRAIGQAISDGAATAFLMNRNEPRLPRMKSRAKREKVAESEAVRIAQLLDGHHLAALRERGVL